MTEIPIIVTALRRHKITVAILLLEFAITFALLTNMTLLVSQRFVTVHMSSGVDEHDLIIVTPSTSSLEGYSDMVEKAQTARQAIAALPQVRQVTLTATPFSGDDRISGRFGSQPDNNSAAFDVSVYMADQSMRETMGLRLVAGRWFAPEEYLSSREMPDSKKIHVTVVTRSLASKLFNKQDPVGRLIYGKYGAKTIIGVVDHLARPSFDGLASAEDVAIYPAVPPPAFMPSMAIRIDAGSSVDSMRKRISAELTASTHKSLSWKILTFEEQRDEYFASDRAALRIMIFLLAALIIVATTAIAGLSYHWINQRSAHVATRRALGAMRREVVAYFFVENLLLSIAGIALGLALSAAINQWLVIRFGVSQMPVAPLVAGLFVLVVSGQVAILYPAWRMGSVAPALAARV